MFFLLQLNELKYELDYAVSSLPSYRYRFDQPVVLSSSGAASDAIRVSGLLLHSGFSNISVNATLSVHAAQSVGLLCYAQGRLHVVNSVVRFVEHSSISLAVSYDLAYIAGVLKDNYLVVKNCQIIAGGESRLKRVRNVVGLVAHQNGQEVGVYYTKITTNAKTSQDAAIFQMAQ